MRKLYKILIFSGLFLMICFGSPFDNSWIKQCEAGNGSETISTQDAGNIYIGTDSEDAETIIVTPTIREVEETQENPAIIVVPKVHIRHE